MLFYNYASVSQSSLSVSPSNFLTSELKYVSCCLLVPAGFHEKYPCVLTETQQSRRSGGVCFLILLFEQAECIFPKPQNHLACALALSVWGRRLVGTMVHLWGQCLGVCCFCNWGAPTLCKARQVSVREAFTFPFVFSQIPEDKICLFPYLSLSCCGSAEQPHLVCCLTLAPEWHLQYFILI